MYVVVVQTLGTLTLLALAGAVTVGVLLALRSGRERLAEALSGQARHPIAWAWMVAFTATLGSLYLSEGAGFTPCSLCWYQRIAMYPLVLVLGVGVVRADAGVWRFALPLPLVGLLISAYHVALQYRPSLEILACEEGVPCSARYVAVFGFVSIPVMAGAAFLLIAALLLLVRLSAVSSRDEALAEVVGASSAPAGA